MAADPRLIQLLAKYPPLKSRLRKIWNTTKHPDDLVDEDEDANGESRRGKGNWSQEGADKKAVALLIEEQLRDDGISEFVELVQAIQQNEEAPLELS